MNDESMRLTLGVTKALSDIQRLRVLMMLRSGELCVCQIIEVLGLAASTVSKHLSILSGAGLVDFRKEGRWAYYRLPDAANGLFVQPLRDWLDKSLHYDSQIRSDQKKLASVTACDPVSVSKRQRECGDAFDQKSGVLGKPALPEIRDEGSQGAALGDRAIRFRGEHVQQGRAGSPSTPPDGGDTEKHCMKSQKRRVYERDKKG